MNQSALTFTIINLKEESVRGKKILEIGSALRGSQRGNFKQIAKAWNCCEYVGIDAYPGTDVDHVIPIENLHRHFQDNSFDIVLCFEVIEHIKDWRKTIRNIHRVCKTDGNIILTTRSEGFPYHPFPHDYWRFSLDDMNQIFQFHHINSLEKDPLYPGVFVSVKNSDSPSDHLDQIDLYSIIKNKRINKIRPQDSKSTHFKIRRMKDHLANKIVSAVKYLLRFDKTEIN